MSELLDHVSRIMPTWARTNPLTECGRRVDDTGSTITFDEMVAKVKRQGKQRASMSSCMTCWGKVSYGQAPASDVMSIAAAYLSRTHRLREEVGRELEAIDALVAAHLPEYEQLLEAVQKVQRIGGQP